MMKRQRPAPRIAALLLVVLAISTQNACAQSGLSLFVDALKEGRTDEMNSIVLFHESQLKSDFFQILKETSSQLGTNREQGETYLLVSIALARSFATLPGNRLSRSFMAESSRLTGYAQGIYSDENLVQFLGDSERRVGEGLESSVATDLRSIVNAYELSSLPAPARQLLDLIEKAKAQQAQREVAERERKLKLEEEERLRLHKKAIAEMVARKDLTGLRKMFGQADAEAKWELYDALLAAGDAAIVADMTNMLIGRLGDSDANVQAEALKGFTRVGAPAIPIIVDRLKDPANPDFNLALARVLRGLHYQADDSNAGAYLLVVQYNVEALVKRGATARPAVLSLLRSTDSTAVLDAISFLRQTGTEEDVPLMEPLLSNSNADVREATKSAIWQLSRSLSGTIRAAWLIAPVMCSIAVLMVLTSFWWVRLIYRFFNPPLSRRIRTICKAASSRENALAEAFELVSRRRRRFSPEAVAELETLSKNDRPEMRLLLAWDSARRGDSSTATERLRRLWSECRTSMACFWIAPRVCSAMETLQPNPLPADALRPFQELQRNPHNRAVVRLINDRGNPQGAFLTALKELSDLGALPPEQKKELDDRKEQSPEFLVVLASDSIRAGMHQEAARLLSALDARVRADKRSPLWVLDEAIALLERADHAVPLLPVLHGLRVSRFVTKPAVSGDLNSKEALRKALAEVTAGPLPAECREELDRRADKDPEVLVILAHDDLLRGRSQRGESYLEKLAGCLRNDKTSLDWVVNMAAEAKVAGIEKLQTTLRRLKESRFLKDLLVGGIPRDLGIHRERAASLLSLGSLPAGSREELGRSVSGRPDLLLILAVDDMRSGKHDEALAGMARIAEQLIAHPGTPGWVLDEALGTIRSAGTDTGNAKSKTHLLHFAARVSGLLAKPASGDELKARLNEAESEFEKTGEPLPDQMRSTIQKEAAHSPELEIILASDDQRRGSGGAAFERYVRLMGRLENSDRIGTALLDAWNNRSRSAGTEVQEQLRKSAMTGSNDAWIALALVRLQNGNPATTGNLGKAGKSSAKG